MERIGHLGAQSWRSFDAIWLQEVQFIAPPRSKKSYRGWSGPDGTAASEHFLYQIGCRRELQQQPEKVAKCNATDGELWISQCEPGTYL